jgi:hypothetical protein
MQYKVRFQNDSDGRGWVVWISEKRGWQPVTGCNDPDEIPTVDDIIGVDPISDTSDCNEICNSKDRK